jgi:hypothetical protein
MCDPSDQEALAQTVPDRCRTATWCTDQRHQGAAGLRTMYGLSPSLPESGSSLMSMFRPVGWFLAAQLLLHPVFSPPAWAADVPRELSARTELIRRYNQLSSDTIVSVVRNDLLSEEQLLQDAGCIVLLTTLDRLNHGIAESDTVFIRLSADANVARRAEAIISERMADWQITDVSDSINDDFPLYVPLFRILGRAAVKSARGVMINSVLTFGNRSEFLNVLPFDEQTALFLMKRLNSLTSTSCCVYPGKSCVLQTLDLSGRKNLLHYYSDISTEHPGISPSTVQLMGDFIVECLNFGNERYGAPIRLEALAAAASFMNATGTDLRGVIEKRVKNDPYFVHEKDPVTIYSLTRVRYPVREAAAQILRH